MSANQIKNKVRKHILFLLLLHGSAVLNAQDGNLIPNPGFEQYNYLPAKGRTGISCAKLWKNPDLNANGDYYHSGSLTRKYKTGRNAFGKQQPHEGNAYAGICVNKKFREFLQIQLLKPLEKDKEYRISVFISCPDKLWVGKLDEFGIIFSKKNMNINGNNYLIDPPAVIFREGKKYNNKKDWIELTSIYKASGYEKVMTFGSFLYREKVIVETKEHGKITGLSKYAHYYIDDFSIMPLDDDLPVQASNDDSNQPIINSKPDFVKGKVYVFNSIQFETGKSELLPKAYPDLNELIFYLRKNPSAKILITGHTDNEGNATDNLKLSYDRAQAVMSYLLSNEINEKQIFIEGKGDQFPIDSNNTEQGREKNRRVEVSFF
ncbi:MAG TPA: OmpA family protein [Bacteroidia bacterium]|jgi:outer membrane protein OmpA-like peptidoglycan-associated protein|nr:OmpA family protein [Bacteroidia bacterium]